MTLPFSQADRPIRRHDLIFLSPAGWRALLAARADLAAEPLLARWVENGWPVIGRRPMASDGPGVPAGLPLPPFAGKNRLSFLLPPADIVAMAPPPVLDDVMPMAPVAWRHALGEVEAMASRHAIEARVFGSLAWQALTGLNYLTDRSDLDLLLELRRDTDLQALAEDLAGIEICAPMRLDGELIRRDGAAINWRELRTATGEILVKTLGGVALLDRSQFLRGEFPS
ncbi:MAG TPA: malonate decarboxylase holo-[acyl-carrier-protein] synthase [Dongiaceae bacterium]